MSTISLERAMKNTSSPTKQKWEGRWEQLTGKAKKIWGNLTDDDIAAIDDAGGEVVVRAAETQAAHE